MEKEELHEMFGGMMFQTTVTITFFFLFCQLLLCAVVCFLVSLYVVYAKM